MRKVSSPPRRRLSIRHVINDVIAKEADEPSARAYTLLAGEAATYSGIATARFNALRTTFT